MRLTFCVIRLTATHNPNAWWDQFPPQLKLITKARLWASIGAGGVLYLTPLVFNELGFNPLEIGNGLAFAAFAGTISRFITGIFLDRGINCSTPIKLAAISVVIADLFLFFAEDYNSYLQGQILLGTAAGLYWPSVEISVPISCRNYSSKKGFALVRSADALGVTLGISLGTLASYFNFIRCIYLLDIACMIVLLNLLRNFTFAQVVKKSRVKKNIKEIAIILKTIIKENSIWIKKIIPILMISLFSTCVLSLLQSGLPLDLVKGGINRPPLNETISGFIITIQLFLLLLFQWPIGKWLSNKSTQTGLRISLLCLGFGCLTLCISSIWRYGLSLTILSLLSIAIGLTSFLPTATDAVIKLVPVSRQGIAIAMYSQCFGISALIAPFIVGQFFEVFGNGFFLWFFMTIISLLIFPLVNKLNPDIEHIKKFSI